MNDETAVPALMVEPLTLRFGPDGLIPVVAQDDETGDVLLLAWMNAEALRATLADGLLTLWSRSRQALWRKGETSGNLLRVHELRVNCEGDSLLARVRLEGVAACHEGYRSCYYRTLVGDASEGLSARVTLPRLFDPATVYGDDDPDGALERDTRLLYAAYERLRDGALIPDSRTSALLHAEDAREAAARAESRAHEELEELRGAVAGTHQHYGDERDVILEASQTGYWAMLAAVALRLPYDAVSPASAWLDGWRGLKAQSDAGDSDDDVTRLRALLAQAGAICQKAGIHPELIVAVDLAEMRRTRGV